MQSVAKLDSLIEYVKFNMIRKESFNPQKMKREIKSVVPFCDLEHRGPNAWIENMMITMIRFSTWKTVFDEFLVLLHKRVLEKYSHMNKKKNKQTLQSNKHW